MVHHRIADDFNFVRESPHVQAAIGGAHHRQRKSASPHGQSGSGRHILAVKDHNMILCHVGRGVKM